MLLERNSFVVMSACKGENQTVDWENTLSLKRALKNMGFTHKQAIGKYNETVEISFVVPVETTECANILLELSRLYQQECILLVHGASKESFLLKENTDPEYIGHWKEIDAGYVYMAKSYTQCDDKYYQCV